MHEPKARRAQSPDDSAPIQLPAAPRRAVPDEPQPPHGAPPRRGLDEPSKKRRFFFVIPLVLGVAGACAFALTMLPNLAGDSPDRSHAADPPLSGPSLNKHSSPTTNATQPPDGNSRAPARLEEVGDIKVNVPAGWELYDEVIQENERRLIRVRDPHNNVRVQLTTLTSLAEEPLTACQTLITEQAAEYGVDHYISPQMITLAASGTGVTCGFKGTKQDQGDATQVSFTIVERPEDKHALIMRVMYPDSLALPNDALNQATLLSCQSAASFGVPFPLC